MTKKRKMVGERWKNSSMKFKRIHVGYVKRNVAEENVEDAEE